MTSREIIKIQWDGPALDDHFIEVEDLAPALLALADLVTSANRIANNESATIKVLVSAKPEQNCVVFDIQLLQSIIAATRSILQQDDLATIKDIMRWLEFTASIGEVGLFSLMKAIKGKKIKKVTEVKNAKGNNIAQIEVHGDNNTVNIISTSPEVYKMASDRKTIRSAEKFLKPLNNQGISDMTVDSGVGSRQVFTQDMQPDVNAVLNSIDIEKNNTSKTQMIEVYAKVYSPVFDEKVDKWRFDWGDGPKYMDISDTTIASDAVKRGGVNVGDTYHLEIEMVQTLGEDEKPKSIEYKVKKVLEFKQAPSPSTQKDIFDYE